MPVLTPESSVANAPAQGSNRPLPSPPKGSDYFLLIEDIPGESKDSKRKDNIRLEGFRFREQQPGQTDVGEGLAAGRAQAGCFTFQCRLDRATPKLFLACAQGDHIEKMVELVARKAGGQQEEYLRYTFHNVVFSRVAVSADGSAA